MREVSLALILGKSCVQSADNRAENPVDVSTQVLCKSVHNYTGSIFPHSFLHNRGRIVRTFIPWLYTNILHTFTPVDTLVVPSFHRAYYYYYYFYIKGE